MARTTYTVMSDDPRDSSRRIELSTHALRRDAQAALDRALGHTGLLIRRNLPDGRYVLTEVGPTFDRKRY